MTEIIKRAVDKAAEMMHRKKVGAPFAAAAVCHKIGGDENDFRQICSELGKRSACHRRTLKHHGKHTLVPVSVETEASSSLWYRQGQYA